MIPLESTDNVTEATCFHCGDAVIEGGVQHDGKSFCCAGCRVVYALLQENNLGQYYELYAAPGRTSTFEKGNRFSYLDDPAVQQKLLDFTDGTTSAVTFTIPRMHCSSCVWLLERLYIVDPGIFHARVDFLKKQLRIRFTRSRTSLRRVVEVLASLGYEPEITLASAAQPPLPNAQHSLYYKIGIAGFCFGNIMLLSFPEYLSTTEMDQSLLHFFTALSMLLSLPVITYSASDYFRSAFAGLRKRVITIDVPLAIGILILFLRSLYEILILGGSGYLDSMSGLVLLLLLGRLFQTKTYDRLSFDRDYTSYFPLAVTTVTNGAEVVVPVSGIRAGDRILLRNNEISPADGILLNGNASLDYSFVTGESHPVSVNAGSMIYAGGRQIGSTIEVEILKEVSRSYLTQLWNDFPGSDRVIRSVSRIADTTGKYFTFGVVALAGLAAMLWFPTDPSRAWNAVTAVLIVACPCAIALSIPFTFGATLRIFGRNGLYLKNTSVVERLSRVDSIVFDKTGTLTHARRSSVEFLGHPLTSAEESQILSLVRHSHHPLSRVLAGTLSALPRHDVANFAEQAGLGLQGYVDGMEIRLGTREFTHAEDSSRTASHDDPERTRVWVSIGGVCRGAFLFQNAYREGLDELVTGLGRRYRLHLVSGDGPSERRALGTRFGRLIDLHFRHSPAEKRQFIRSLQEQGRRVLMLGDGLNDAGALLQSDVGVAFTEDIASFSPACDAILEADAFGSLEHFLRLARESVAVVLASLAISLVYNAVGLSFALRGELSPLIAAILMPLSSITVVAFTTFSVRALARKRGFR
jgi:Cu+-exporting ATPase